MHVRFAGPDRKCFLRRWMDGTMHNHVRSTTVLLELSFAIGCHTPHRSSCTTGQVESHLVSIDGPMESTGWIRRSETNVTRSIDPSRVDRVERQHLYGRICMDKVRPTTPAPFDVGVEDVASRTRCRCRRKAFQPKTHACSWQHAKTCGATASMDERKGVVHHEGRKIEDRRKERGTAGVSKQRQR